MTLPPKGNEHFAIVEFAPFQKVPQERKKPDARVGTINQGATSIKNSQSSPYL